MDEKFRVLKLTDHHGACLHTGIIDIDVYIAKGGVLREGTAMVAEAGPELLSMVNGKAVVTPLTGSAVNTAADNLKGNNRGFHQEINITSPKALSPYEVARQTRIQTRAMVIAMQRG